MLCLMCIFLDIIIEKISSIGSIREIIANPDETWTFSSASIM